MLYRSSYRHSMEDEHTTIQALGESHDIGMDTVHVRSEQGMHNCLVGSWSNLIM